MATRTHNEFLDDGEDSEDQRQDDGYDSEAHEESRAARSSKRRKVDVHGSDEDDESLSDNEDEDNNHAKARAASVNDPRFKFARENEDEPADEEDQHDTEDAPNPPKTTGLTSTKAARKMAKQLEASHKAVHKSGVIYISRVPPFMKPHTLKHFLEPHAPKGLGRIFLTPEEHAAHVRRVKSGGNKKKSFTDGWVEFLSKKDAKIAAETLNGNIIGGRKGNFYHDDLWNIKYLKGFKWNHLTEQIANENAERAARLREEIRRTREENRAFVEDVEKAKMLEGMETKKKAKLARLGGSAEEEGREQQKSGREFKQQRVQSKREIAKPGDSANSTLRMVFG